MAITPDDPFTHGQFQTFQSRLFDYLERQFQRIDQRFDAMVSRFDELEARVDSLYKRFDRLEAKYADRASRMSILR